MLKAVFEVIDKTDEVSLKHCFEVVDETHCFKVVDGTDEAAQNMVLRLQIEHTVLRL
ncbi:hypothetical protein [Streptococcus pneumoniae]|uniref:hypothetical protein n=1 Tax=Streptococcus pneumoniae TaxID=1313 RepID=UPI000B2FF897|nr:hypothetical protein [Streptococcus pneumoniae]